MIANISCSLLDHLILPFNGLFTKEHKRGEGLEEMVEAASEHCTILQRCSGKTKTSIREGEEIARVRERLGKMEEEEEDLLEGWY